jgi:hypothetical protein
MPRKKPVATDGRETNEQLVARLMSFPKSGPIMQLFVIEALRRYAALCADGDLTKMDLGPISGAHWKRCAVELHAEINKHLGE